jgi:hypothetical protein
MDSNCLSFLPHHIHPQIRATWISVAEACAITNIETSTASFIALFVTDFLLLVIMLAGLLRLRRRGGDTFELGRLLWRQVGWWSSLAVMMSIR